MSHASSHSVTAPATRHFFLVAGEESGDRLGGGLMRAIKSRTGGNVRFSGAGGRDMIGEGLACLHTIDDLPSVGIMMVLLQFRSVLRRIRDTANAVVAAKPDALIIIDSPDFTHRVARLVRRAAPSIPIVDYVCPQVWAWRPWRARKMRRYIDHVLALLPFEPAALERLGGPPCTYVGHPLGDRVAELRPSAEEAARRMAEPPVVVVLPGSRRNELRWLGQTFADALALVRERAGPLELILPTVPPLAAQVRAAVANWPIVPRVVVDPTEKNRAFRIARAALAKSGTVTLELAIAGVPMVTGYRVGAIDAFIARRMIQVPSVILANLVIGENVIPELLQQDCTPAKLADGLLPLLGDTPQRRRQIEAFSRLDAIMQIGTLSPAAQAADVILDLARGPEAIAAGSAVA
jgi:lipid-A-disaccharide synthase